MPSSSPTRNAPVAVTVLLAILGLALIAIAAFYFTHTADQLPSFFPGHQAGSSHHHTKHGVAALVLGLAAWVAAWMSAGKKTPH
jgi:H+/Cl- antiporter ClcA